MEIFEARVLGENLYLHQRFKVEDFLYIIQIMLQYTPSFNKDQKLRFSPKTLASNISMLEPIA
jgi:hypothetical protein